MRNGPDGDDASGLIGNVVQVAGAVQLHGPAGRHVHMRFPDPGRRDLPGLEAVAELSASCKRSEAGHPGVHGPAAPRAFSSETLEVTSVRGEVVEGLLSRPVDFFGPRGLGIELVRHVIEAVACVGMKRDCGTFHHGAGFEALPRLYLLRDEVILKCSRISKFHSRGIVTSLWFIQFTFRNIPSPIIILGERKERF